MPRWARPASIPELAGFAVLVACVVILAALAVRRYLRNRVTAEEQERRRRAALDRGGKVGDGEVIEFDGDSLVYSWQVAGVVYTAAQDISALKSRLPEDRMSCLYPIMIGPVSVKYDPRNPANSIVLCEEWSGLRLAPSAGPDQAAPSPR